MPTLHARLLAVLCACLLGDGADHRDRWGPDREQRRSGDREIHLAERGRAGVGANGSRDDRGSNGGCAPGRARAGLRRTDRHPGAPGKPDLRTGAAAGGRSRRAGRCGRGALASTGGRHQRRGRGPDHRSGRRAGIATARRSGSSRAAPSPRGSRASRGWRSGICPAPARARRRCRRRCARRRRTTRTWCSIWTRS